MNKTMKDFIKEAALDLIKKNGGTTTLEVKNELIATQPAYFWKQKEISSAMIQLEREGEFILYADNGTFRTYTVLGFVRPATAAKPNVLKVSLTALAKLVQDNSGNQITLTHKKKNGDINVMDCEVLPDRNALGAFLVIEQGQMKSVYPQSLLEVRIGSDIYQLKGK